MTMTASATAAERAQLRLDLARFDAETAQLDLPIDASEKIDLAVRSESSGIARRIEHGVRDRRSNG